MSNFFENLPRHIRIGPYQDSFHVVPSLKSDRGQYVGGCRIKLSSKANETPQEALDTVLHEILHSIWDKARIGKGKMSEEVIIATFGSWLAAALIDNQRLLKWVVEMTVDHHEK